MHCMVDFECPGTDKQKRNGATTMETLKRCPFCFKFPTFTVNKKGEWIGGCNTNITEMCSVLKDAVLQPNAEFAANQWNYHVTQSAHEFQEMVRLLS